jgi:hypothetical protein
MAVSAALLMPALAYAGLAAGVVGVALFARGGGGHPATITRWSALAFGYVTLAGPGMMAPRRQLVRLLSGLAPDRWSTARAGLVLAGIAAVAACAAWVSGPHWWPLAPPYGHVGRLAHLLSSLPRHL